MMRVIVAHVYHESNTFCVENTKLEDFEYIKGSEMLKMLPGTDILTNAGIEVKPTIYAQRWSSGTVEKRAFLAFEADILDALRKEGNTVDGLFLSLHGGMTVEGIGSGEYRLLSDIRDAIGYDIPIAVSMDMHANLSLGIEKLANVFTGYHTAPHIDEEETQRKAARALVRLLQSGALPRPAMLRLPMLLVGERALSKDEPFRTIYSRCRELENDSRFLAATMFVGMAWSDTRDTAASVMVSPAKPEYAADAQEEAKHLARHLFENRDACPYAHPTYLPEEAVARAIASNNAPLYLSDSGDNPTAGGVGDSTVLLRLASQAETDKRFLFSPLFDAAGWEKAASHREGECFLLDIGSKREPYCAPVSLTVELIHRCEIMAKHGLSTQKVGDGVLLRCRNIDIVLVNAQMSFTGLECFETAGVNISDYDVVVLKMGYMFAEISAPCRENIMALTPGSTPLLITAEQYHNLPRPIWPLDKGVSFNV